MHVFALWVEACEPMEAQEEHVNSAQANLGC